MDPLALGFIAVAAVLHAAWNILLKTAGDPLRTATLGMAAASAVVVPGAIVLWIVTDRPSIPPQTWAVGAVSGLFETAYFVFLSEAYRRGDLSVVYPIARGTAPLLAVAIGVLVLGEVLAPAAWAGVALLLMGLLVVQRPWRMLARAGGAPPGAGFALLTGAMIAGYTAVDRVGVQLAPAWLYAAIIWPASAAGLVVVDRLRARRRQRAAAGEAGASGETGIADPPVDRRRAVVGGLLTFAAYGFVLAALARAPLAIVAPLRESAVVLTSLWGVVRLGEGGGDRREVAFRVAGSVLVLAGAFVLAVGG